MGMDFRIKSHSNLQEIVSISWDPLLMEATLMNLIIPSQQIKEEAEIQT